MIIRSQFTDILLITSLSINEKYRIHHKFPLKNLLVCITTMQCTMTVDIWLLQVKRLEPFSVRNGFCIAEKGQRKPMRFATM